ncbi:MAG: hypothetical protein ACRERV_00430 [Methylococcales bacterium]
MKTNELLLWLSARREGSWQQFRQVVEELHTNDEVTDIETNDEFPLHQRLKLNFERLAHAEFFAEGCEKGWRVAPPVLSLHPVSCGVRGILCSARSPALRERVLLAAQKYQVEIQASLEAPDIIRIVVPHETALAKLAEQTHIYLQHEAPLAILWYLPPCDPPSGSYSRSEFPQGKDWTIHKFDSKDLKWRKIERGEVESIRFGVLRFSIYFQPEQYFLRSSRSAFRMPRAVALFALLRHHRRRILHYDRKTAVLSVPAICRPPSLVERALVLCSGLPPVYTESRLDYFEVPFDIAKLAAELLRQPLT